MLLSKERNLFKLFYCDVGILTGSFSRKVSLALLDATHDVNVGATYENAVAQELHAHGFDLYYYNSKKYGELDFVVENRDGVINVIEVKSGKYYKRHRALDNVLAIDSYRLASGYVLGQTNIERNGKILYMPIYMIGLFTND